MVRDIAEDVGARLKRFSRVRDVDTNAAGRCSSRTAPPSSCSRLDRARLAAHGLTARDVVAHVGRGAGSAGAGGQVVLVGGKERHAHAALERRYAMRTCSISSSRSCAGRQASEVRLGEIASFEEREVMSRIVRENQQYQRIVAYEFRGPVKLGDRYRDAVVTSTALPAGFALETDSQCGLGRGRAEADRGVARCRPRPRLHGDGRAVRVAAPAASSCC